MSKTLFGKNIDLGGRRFPGRLRACPGNDSSALKSSTRVSTRSKRVYLKAVMGFDKRELVKCNLSRAGRGKLPERTGQRAQAVPVAVDQHGVARLEVLKEPYPNLPHGRPCPANGLVFTRGARWPRYHRRGGVECNPC